MNRERERIVVNLVVEKESSKKKALHVSEVVRLK